MGNHSKLDRYSTNVSTRTDPGSGQKATGYVAGEQPVAKEMNWLIGETIDKVNDVIEDQTISGFSDDVGMDPIIQKYIAADGDAGWSQAHDAPNVIDHGTANAWVDLCAHVTTAGVRELLALDGNSSCQISRFDALTGALNGVSGDLSTGNLPSGGGEDWVPECMCSDGTTVYVMFGDQNAAPNQTYRVQAFTISTWASKWGGTGTALTGTGAMQPANNHGGIVVASATQIATANSWVSWVNNSTECVTLIGMSDGVIDDEGAGDMPSGYAIDVTSDGTNLYIITTGHDVCTATLADLTAGVGGNWPYLTATASIIDILHTGKLIIASWGATAGILRLFTSAGSYSIVNTGDTAVIELGGELAWDGLCVWERCQIDVDGNARTAVARIDVNSCCHIAAGTEATTATAEKLMKTVMILDPDTVAAAAHQSSPICYDGRDIWVVGDQRDLGDGGTLSGKIYRIPKAVLR